MTEIHVFEISRTLEISKKPDTNLHISSCHFFWRFTFEKNCTE